MGAPSGCDEHCGSTLAFDACGVCGGDGSSCTGCNATNQGWLGDGWCDGPEYNNADCEWDGGDCCKSTCESTQDTRDYECGHHAPYDCKAPGLIYCAGDNGGTAVLDACGVCDGPGIPEGHCDCLGSVDHGCGCGEPAPSGCDNQCGSTLVNDECGV